MAHVSEFQGFKDKTLKPKPSHCRRRGFGFSACRVLCPFTASNVRLLLGCLRFRLGLVDWNQELRENLVVLGNLPEYWVRRESPSAPVLK